MAIRRPDGSIYTVSGCLGKFNPAAQSHKLFSNWDAEIIKLGGSPIFYYEAIVPPSTIDPIYWESRSMLWTDTPTVLYALYEPLPIQNYQDMFGVDSGTDTIIFELNYKDVVQRLGHVPKLDSRIYTPHKGENWKILQRTTDLYQDWGELRLNLICDKFQESLTTDEGKVTKRSDPDITGNPNDIA